MRNLVPLTKILLTLGTAVWAIVLHRPESLLYLCVLELLILLISGELFKNMKALIMLIVFAALLGVQPVILWRKIICSRGIKSGLRTTVFLLW